jgi:cell division protein FtsX
MRRIWRWLGTVGAVVAVAVISDVTSAWADSIGPVTEQVNPSEFWIENKPHFTGFVIWVLASIAIGTGLVISASSYFRS